jgi:hypothetical protein
MFAFKHLGKRAHISLYCVQSDAWAQSHVEGSRYPNLHLLAAFELKHLEERLWRRRWRGRPADETKLYGRFRNARGCEHCEGDMKESMNVLCRWDRVAVIEGAERCCADDMNEFGGFLDYF